MCSETEWLSAKQGCLVLFILGLKDRWASCIESNEHSKKNKSAAFASNSYPRRALCNSKSDNCLITGTQVDHGTKAMIWEGSPDCLQTSEHHIKANTRCSCRQKQPFQLSKMWRGHRESEGVLFLESAVQRKFIKF